MQLVEYIYLLNIPVLQSFQSFEQFISLSSLVNSRGYSLKDTVTIEFLSEFMDMQESKVILETLALVENSILFLCIVLFNQLQYQYNNTRSTGTGSGSSGTTSIGGTRGTIECSSEVQEKYTKTLEFWKSQIREFMYCISTIQNPGYLKLENTDFLKVSKDLVLDIINLLVLDVDMVPKMDLGFVEIQEIMESINTLPKENLDKQIIQGKSKNVIVLKDCKSVIISRYFYLY